MDSDVQLVRRAGPQHGLVTRADVAAAGLSSSAWCRRLASGSWVQQVPNVYRSPAAAPTYEQRCFGLLLSTQPDGILSHRTAARLLGLDGFDRETSMHVTVDHRRRILRPNAAVHRSQTLTPRDVVVVRGMNVTAGARTLCDLAGYCSIRQLEDAVDSAMRNQIVTETDLRLRLAELRGRGARKLDVILDGLPQGGLHTRLEREFLILSRAAGLPDPHGQVVMRETSAFLARVDFFYDSLNLVVEVSGHRSHSTRSARANDAKRQRGLVRIGRRVVEFTSDEVFHQSVMVQREIRALAA